MKSGKILGIIAFVCAVVVTIFAFIGINQAPEIRSEVFDLMVTDMELAEEMLMEDFEKASPLFKFVDGSISIISLVGIVLAIISIVKKVKAGEKGKILPVISIILIIVFFFVYTFGVIDMGAAFQAGLEAGMSAAQ